MNDAEARELAEAHWEYVEKICRIMYTDAFVHGIKHGQEDKIEDNGESDCIKFGTYIPYEIKK